MANSATQMKSEGMKIAVLLTCHNRKDQTLECLAGLSVQTLRDEILISVVLMDDGSSDGTSEAVAGCYPEVEILRGCGDLYWCGGMRAAWQHAARLDPDYYLLLNDDTVLDPSAVQRLLDICSSSDCPIISVAAIRDPETGAHTYGGVRGANTAVPVSGRLEACETFNANAVLIPRVVYEEQGGFHDVYTHAMGDFDYGYQASRNGIRLIQSAESLGTCGRNSPAGTWRDTSLSRRERFRKLQSPKGLPFKQWVLYNRRNSGCLWPYRCITPYLRILLGR